MNGRPVLEQVLAALVQQPVHCLQQHNLEYLHAIKARAASLAAI